MIGRTIAELAPGDRAELVRRIDMTDISEFVGAVGDHNPIHSDPDFAAQTSFQVPIAPGVFTAGLISGVIGTQLPGPGAIYLSQSLKFIKPVKAGDTITARVEVLEVLRERNRIRLSTVCRNQAGEDVVTGEAWVMPPRTAISYERGPVRPRALSLTWQPWTWVAASVTLWSRLTLSMLVGSLPRPATRMGGRSAMGGPEMARSATGGPEMAPHTPRRSERPGEAGGLLDTPSDT